MFLPQFRISNFTALIFAPSETNQPGITDMKLILFLALCICGLQGFAQTLQLHYDIRHTLDPQRNPRNFPSLYFEYYKAADTSKKPINLGTFLFKSQADFTGDQTNLGKYYMQVSQEVKLWLPKIYLNLQYSGGLGITTPRQYSYYILNTYLAGASYHYKIGDAYVSSVLNYKYVPYAQPSQDFLYTMYFYKGLFNYKAEISGDFSIWTENKNHGDEQTKDLAGKRAFFFAEPQVWYNVNKKLALGSKVNMYYHVNFTDNVLEVYPTAAVRLRL